MKVFWVLGNLYFILLLRLVILLFICTNTLKSYLGDAVLVLPDLRGKQRQFKKKKRHDSNTSQGRVRREVRGMVQMYINPVL